MGGTPLWVESEGASVFESLGKCLYNMFNTVFFLTKNYRQGGATAHELADFFVNYRKGALSEEDWNWFESRARDPVSDNELDGSKDGEEQQYPSYD